MPLHIVRGDEIHLHSGCQNVYDDRREVARMLCIPNGAVKVHGMLVGGGFGGKEDMTITTSCILVGGHRKTN